MRKSIWGGLLAAAWLWANPAAAVHVDDYRLPYITGSAVYEISDSARRSGNGLGYQISGGAPLGEQSAVEFTFYDVSRRRDRDGGSDRQFALFPNFVYDFGLWGFDEHYLPNFKPYVLAGPGFISEDVRGGLHSAFGLDGGAGVLIPLHVRGWNWGWAVRGEVSAVASFNHGAAVPGESTLLDYHISLGLQIPLTRLFYRPHPRAHQIECELAVVDPVTGRRDCQVDSDGDGVPDNRDQCPGTPPGTQVDAVGCPLTPPPHDSDGDGVVDNSDKCPDTPRGAQVDAQGCAVPQLLAAPVIHFASDSAELPADAPAVLDELAISLEGQANMNLVLEGHADTSGREHHNLDLSERRAQAVRQYLLHKGIAPERLRAQGFNGLRPVAANGSSEGRARNRRVEFRIVAP